MIPTLDLANISLSDGTLRYTEKRIGNGFELGAFSMDVHHLQLAGGENAELMPLKNADAFVAFTGMDPRPDDSGQHRGKRRLSKRGPSELRLLLFLTALSAAKTKAWHPLYEHYREKGLSSTAVLVILARRIARSLVDLHSQDRI